MRIDRRTLKSYLRKTASWKRMQKLSFLNPEKVEHRRRNREEGLKRHEEYTYALQEQMSEKLSVKENELTNKLKEKGLKKAEITEYMDKWASINLWPKPADYHQVRKELKKLNKKYDL